MKKIVYIPLDERPCNYDFPYIISENNPIYRMIRPDESLMGSKKTPANYSELAKFITNECADADYLIIALDTLLYGGIIPSRLHNFSERDVCSRLSVLEEIKVINPNLKIFAFSLVMRCPCYSDNAEEPDYYAFCGREIFLYGQNEHKYRDGLISEAEYLKTKDSLRACEEYIHDYTSRRKTNLAVFLRTVDMIGGIIDEFVILQDDSNKFGYTAMDQQKIKAAILERGIDVLIYPGADEGGMTMLARAVCDMMSKKPKIYPAFPEALAAQITPMYEDREVCKSLASQIRSAGAILCEIEDEADIVLFCNIDKTKLFDIAHCHPKGQSDSYIPDFVSRMKRCIDKGIGVAIADIAYCNGGDMALAERIEKEISMINLWGYSGWNTSSNTLGTVICQAIFRASFGDTETHRLFTAYRVYEDLCYYADARHTIRESIKDRYNLTPFDTKEQTGRFTDDILTLLEESAKEHFESISNLYHVNSCSLPWRRIFEIRLDIQKNNKAH